MRENASFFGWINCFIKFRKTLTLGWEAILFSNDSSGFSLRLPIQRLTPLCESPLSLIATLLIKDCRGCCWLSVVHFHSFVNEGGAILVQKLVMTAIVVRDVWLESIASKNCLLETSFVYSLVEVRPSLATPLVNLCT